MSSTPRTATRGGSKSKSDIKGHKSDSKRDGPKNNDASKAQASSERTAYHSDLGSDEMNMKIRISHIMVVMENERTEDEVVTALHDCDDDIDKAVTMLLENGGQGAWTKCGKKRKNRQANAAKTGESTSARTQNDSESGDWDTPVLTTNQDRERERDRERDRDWSRGRGGNSSRPRGRGGADNRGPGRGRDNNKENNGAITEDGQRGGRNDGFRRGGRGMSNGPGGRGGRGGRGGGRLGSRTFQGRDGRSGGDSREKSDGDRFPSTIDTWNPPGSQDSGEKPAKMDTWGGEDKFPTAEDWDNEEYTGSLADSQVFTKSALDGVAASEVSEETSTQDLLDLTTSTSQDFHQSNALSSSPLPVGVGVLNSAQAQYLSQLTQQSSENLKATAAAAAAAAVTVYGQTESLKSAVGIGGNPPYAQNSGYGQTSNYGQGSYSQSSYATPATYPASTGYAAASAAGTAYSASTGAFPQPPQNYQGSNTSSYGVYPSSGGSFSSQGYSGSNVPYDGTTATSDANAPSAQPQRTKVPRPRMPPPSKIPSSAVEMPEDSISSGVSSLDVQFGCLEFGSDNTPFEGGVGETNKFAQPAVNSVVDAVSSGVATDTPSGQQASLNAYSAGKGAGTNAPSTLVAGLTAKALSTNEGLSIQSGVDHKQSYNSQQPRATNSTSGFDLTKSDVGSLSYASAPSGGNYATYQNQKNNAGGYAVQNYSTGSYAVSQTTYSNSGYSNQSSVNSSYNSQPANTTNYSAGGTSYVSNNSFQTPSQNYQSSAGSVYGSNYSGSSYANSYSGSSATNKLNSGLSTTKESQEYSSSTTSSTTTSSLLANTSNSIVATTSSSKTSSGAIKGSVVPNMHPPMMGGPQYIMSSATMPFYTQTPMYGYEDVMQIQRIPHMQPTGYYDMSGYSAPTSLSTGRESMPNVAFTVADARFSTRGDNNASPVPSTLSQQTATAHQQPMMNPSFPPGYTYVYNAVPGSFQYGAPIFPVASAGNAHGSSSNQYGKPTSYGSTYGAGYDGLNQTGDYGKSAYVSGGVKSGVGGASVSSATTVSDLYGKAHTALGKVNSYDKQGFHSATPPPFNLATGQSAGAYPPQLFIPALPPHQQHPTAATALMPSHLQDSTNSSGQRSQSAAQPNKSNKQNYGAYWPPN